MQRSDAITNKIKTEFATYMALQSDVESASESSKATYNPLRLSDNTVVGTQEEISSDVKIPESRIPAIPESGAESCSGNLESEWNIDEQDSLIASVMCGTWEAGSKTGYSEWKELVQGTVKDVYVMLKKYFQEPVAWEKYTGIQIDTMNISMALNSIVKMSFGLLGANNPIPVTTEPDSKKVTYAEAYTTKAFITRELDINIKDYVTGQTEPTFISTDKMRQSPAFELSIANNKERTDALGETEAIEMSDGDFVVSGSFDVWNADDKAINLKADAISRKDKWIEVDVHRGNEGYKIRLIAHLGTPSESKDGNKLKNTIPYTVNVKEGIKFIKYTKSTSKESD